MESRFEHATPGLHGMFRDVLLDRHGRVTWESGWQKNAIVDDCRRLLASLVRGPAATRIEGLLVGAGLSTWDTLPLPPTPSPAQLALVDPNPFLVPVTVPPLPATPPPPPAVANSALVIDFLNGTVVSPTPTNRLQLVATLGPGVPSWPDASHVDITLREFGLAATLNGTRVLLNYRTHPAIAKDPTSTLQRTIWLVF